MSNVATANISSPLAALEAPATAEVTPDAVPAAGSALPITAYQGLARGLTEDFDLCNSDYAADASSTSLVRLVVACFENEVIDASDGSWTSPTDTLPFSDLQHDQHFASLSAVERAAARMLSQPLQWSGKWEHSAWMHSAALDGPFRETPHLTDIVRRRKWSQSASYSGIKPRRNASLSPTSRKVGVMGSVSNVVLSSPSADADDQSHDASVSNAARKTHVKFLLFENERRYLLGNFTSRLLKIDRPHFSNMNGTMERKMSQVEAELPLDAFTWEDKIWQVERSALTDPEGWTYAFQFCMNFSATVTPLCRVRRRAWSRVACPLDSSIAVQHALPPRLLAIASVYDTVVVTEARSDEVVCAEVSPEDNQRAEMNPSFRLPSAEIHYHRTPYDSNTVCSTCFEAFTSTSPAHGSSKVKRHCRSCGRLHCARCCKLEEMANFSRVCRGCLQIIVEQKTVEQQKVEAEKLAMGETTVTAEEMSASVSPGKHEPRTNAMVKQDVPVIAAPASVKKQKPRKACCSVS